MFSKNYLLLNKKKREGLKGGNGEGGERDIE